MPADHARAALPEAVHVELDRDLATHLLRFAAEQGAPLDDQVLLQSRLVDAIAFTVGVAQGATGGDVDADLLDLLGGTCRACGCTDSTACVRIHPDGVNEHHTGARYDTCRWAEPGLCTACAPGHADDWIRPGDQQEAWAA